MNALPDEPETEDEDEGYYPEASLVHEDSALILDPLEFADTYNAAAVMVRGGSMFVLDKDTHQWRNVESFGGPQPNRPRLKGVQ